MKTLSVCVGSACHLQGAYHVLEIFKEMLKEYELEITVDIEGNFCRNNCTRGVVVKFDENLVFDVNKDNAREIFKQYMLGGE